MYALVLIDEAEFLRLMGNGTGYSDEDIKGTEATPELEDGNLFTGLEEN